MLFKGPWLAAALIGIASVAPVQAQVVDGKQACWEDASCSRLGRVDLGEGDGTTKRVVPQFKPVVVTKAAVKPASPVDNSVKVAIQVSQNDKATMTLALNNARNIIEQFKGSGKKVEIEVVAYGPGLHMLRADTSPVKDRIGPMALEHSNLRFLGCGNTQSNQSKAEGKPVVLLSEAKVTPSGVVRLIELQEQGFAYVRP